LVNPFISEEDGIEGEGLVSTSYKLKIQVSP